MKPETVKKLRCIACGSKDFELVVAERDDKEILQGLLVCKNCGYAYAIIDGIIRTINDQRRRERVEKYKHLVPEGLREKVH